MQLILLILSILTSAGLIAGSAITKGVAGGIINGWNDFWIPFIMVAVFFLIYEIIVFLLIAFWSLFLSFKKPVSQRKKRYDVALREVAKFIVMYSNVRIHVTGIEKMPEKERFMFVCNHRSMFDPVLSAVCFARYNIAFVSKKSVFKVPFGAKFMHMCCYIPFDRDDMKDAVRMINRASELLINDVTSIGLYPEGTRSVSDEMLEFKNGAFKIALKAKVPIVVATLKGSDEVARNFPFRRTHVYFKVLEVIPYERFAEMGTKEIGDMVRAIMETDLKV